MTRSSYALSYVVSAGLCAAQTLALAPSQVDNVFQPGQPFQFPVLVSNGGNSPIALRPSVTDLWYDESNGKTFHAPGTSPRSAANWIEVVPATLSLPAGATGKFDVVVTPPAAARGGYYAVVFVESKPELSEAVSHKQQRAVYTNIRLGSLILLTAAGTNNYEIDVSDVRLTAPDQTRPLAVEFALRNRSNTHVFPATRVAVLNARRELVAKTEAETKRFLPDQQDRIATRWAGTLAPGDYTAVLTVVYGPDRVFTKDVPFVVQDPRIAKVRDR